MLRQVGEMKRGNKVLLPRFVQRITMSTIFGIQSQAIMDLRGLGHPVARRGFRLDMSALTTAEATVMVLPCGRSAHLELGIATGTGQRTIVLLDTPVSELELMYLACDAICVSVAEVVELTDVAPFDWAMLIRLAPNEEIL